MSEICQTCGGTGLITASSNYAESTGRAERPCPDCRTPESGPDQGAG